MNSRRKELAIAAALASLIFTIQVHAGEVKYEKPPKAVLDVLNAPPFPTAFPSPSGDTLLLATPVLYPPIADLAKPMLRLAGLRIDPTTNGEHHASYWSNLSLRRVADGAETKVALPAGARQTISPGAPTASRSPSRTSHPRGSSCGSATRPPDR